MFSKKLAALVGAGVFGLMSTAASAGVIGFTSSPGSNSVDFTSAVSSAGGSISTIDFEDHGLGALNGTQYSGITMSTTGSFGGIVYGAGPGQSNTTSPPLNSGEGAHAASNYLLNNAGGGTFTLAFDNAVMGFGLDIIDYYNPSGSNGITIAAYGTSGLIGSFDSFAANFQPNNTYFMGILSDAMDITSIVISDVGSLADVIGYDDLWIASAGTVDVPAPGALGLLCLGLAGLGFSRRKSRQ